MVMTLSFRRSHDLMWFGPGWFCWYWHLRACSCMYSIRLEDKTTYRKTNWHSEKWINHYFLWKIKSQTEGILNGKSSDHILLPLVCYLKKHKFATNNEPRVLAHKLSSITLCWLTPFSLACQGGNPPHPDGWIQTSQVDGFRQRWDLWVYKWAVKKKPGWLFDIGYHYTTQLYGDYFINHIRIPFNQPVYPPEV